MPIDSIERPTEWFKCGWTEKKGKKRYLILIDAMLYWFEKEVVREKRRKERERERERYCIMKKLDYIE
jgi:hypothetical protein